MDLFASLYRGLQNLFIVLTNPKEAGWFEVHRLNALHLDHLVPNLSSSKASCRSVWVEVALKLVVVGIVAVPVAAPKPQ